ncbi:reverse transcriptase domain-containing protein [Tanacetum coccineum]
MTKYCYFYEDHGHKTNDYRKLRYQIEEAVKSGQLSHLVKGIKKDKTKVSDIQQGDRKKENKVTAPVEAPILMISRQDQNQKRKSAEEPINRLGEITFPPVSSTKNPSDLVIIKAQISEREVNRVYMDSRSSCEVIYEHFFLKLKHALQLLRFDSWVLLVGFSGEHSWPLGEVPWEIIIVDGSLTRTEVLNFVIIRSNSPHNLLLGRTTMQRMGIVISTIQGAIKFHTPKGTGTVLSTYEPPERDEKKKKSKATCSKIVKNVLSCEDAEERIIESQEPLWSEEDPSIRSTNAYKGYHQIQLAEEDEDKTTFFAEKEVFCYRKIPFGLKNAGATYQSLVEKVFGDQIGRNLEAYVDDMVIKSTSKEDMLHDIQETFNRFKLVDMKLNPKKYSFGVEEGPFLGHFITNQGIKANPSKVKAVNDLEQPRTRKEIQSFNGKLAPLSRFLSKGAEKVLQGAELNYPAIENLILSLVHAARILRRYFQGHPIKENTDTEMPPEEGDKVETIRLDTGKDGSKLGSIWKLYTDGASSSNGSGAGIMLVNPEGKEYTYALRFEFEMTNKKAEYEALLQGLRIA